MSKSSDGMKYLILDNIRSAHNVGAMFRTADGAGVQKIFLIGYTPTPVDRFGRTQGEIQKTSLGASETVGWEHVEDLPGLIKQLQQEEVTVVAVEQSPTSIQLKDFQVPEKVAYIVGNEVDGISESIQKLSDMVLELPMLGEKESLNVATTAGIVLYHQLSSPT
jgi:23S rRNA (guanosine2251-2'-O)-methyltransferase